MTDGYFSTMNLEDTLTALKEAFTGKSAEAETHAKALADAQALITSKDAELATVNGLVESVKADKVALEAKVASLEADNAKMKEAMELAIAASVDAKAKVESAGKKAAAIAASVGVDAVEISPAVAEASKTNEEVAAEWAALRQKDPKAASEFYTKNRTAIIAAAGLR